MVVRTQEPGHRDRFATALRFAALLSVMALPITLTGCRFLAGAAAGAGVYAVMDNPPGDDDDDDDDDK